jgi:hypothetical protein
MRKKTFKQLLSQTAATNRETLMRRARAANRLAKSTSGKSRQRSYHVKHKALFSLVQKFGTETSIQVDPKTPEMLVVVVDDTGFGLHAPKSLFNG